MTVIRAYLLWAAIAIPIAGVVHTLMPTTLRRGRTTRRWAAISVWPAFLAFNAADMDSWEWAAVFVALAAACVAVAFVGPDRPARRHAEPRRIRAADRIDWRANG